MACALQGLDSMTMDLKVLKCGNCEELKLGVHGLTLGLAALCGLYNAAAWLSRREQHLAVNTVLYMGLIIFEQRHVVHHIAEMRRPRETSETLTDELAMTVPAEPEAPPVAA
jgi:hypothetical protein